MLPWNHLPQGELEALVDEVLNFRRQGVRELVLSIAAENEEELSEEEIEEEVASATTPGEILAAPEAVSTPEAVARGAQLYRSAGCASCHGEQGKGDGVQKMVDSEGLPARPRDLTRGIYKGQPEFADVFRRLRLGMPGSAMPASPLLNDQQLADLAHFVLSLSTPEAREAAVLRRETITAHRRDTLPDGPDDPAWERIPAVAVRLVALWWYFDRPEADLHVQAAHDGRRIALRLTWRDEAADGSAARHEQFADAAAVQFYGGPQEPFVGMGARDVLTEVWLWSAGAPLPRVEEANPRMVVDVYPLSEALANTPEYDRPGTADETQAVLGQPARAVGNPLALASRGAASELEAAGPGTLAFRLPVSRQVAAEGVWGDGTWHVAFTRRLATGESGGLRLRPGRRVSLALALWDGGRAERDGQKQISMWQDLVLEP
jgi:mono/diheme cytochrome c family protein